MAQTTHISVSDGDWVLLTNANVTNVTFQNVSAHGSVWIKATSGATPPTSIDGALKYNAGEGEANVALSSLFSGVSGANRVYALANSNHVTVMVSHA